MRLSLAASDQTEQVTSCNLAPVPEVVVRDATPDDAAGIAHARTRTWQVANAHLFPAEQLADGGVNDEELLGTLVRELRYRITRDRP